MDISIIGIVFAIILFIIFFAAVVLYLSFRIKETFREEKKRGMLAVKVAFLIGILFLAGGSFYFFAQILPSSSPTPSPEPDNPNDTPLPPSNDNGNENGKAELNMYISYPSRTRMNAEITMTFSITNPTEYIAHDVVIQTTVLFEYFNLVSSTHKVTGNVIEIGDISPGTTVSSLNLVASSKPREIRDTITLIFKEMTEQITQDISISVTGGP
jgi:hypothetical protein